MPFKIVRGYIPVVSTIATGDFIFDPFLGDNAWTLEINGWAPVPPGIPIKSGTILYNYDCNGEVEFVDTETEEHFTIPLSQLPDDLVVDYIYGDLNSTNAGPDSFAGIYVSPGKINFIPPGLHHAGWWTSNILLCTLPGWDGKQFSWNPDFAPGLFLPFTIQASLEGYKDMSDLRTIKAYLGCQTDAYNYGSGPYRIPTNVLAFQGSGTFEPVSYTLGPITNPGVGPGPSITVTPPPGATDIVTTPPTVTTPVVGPGPITIPIAPGTPVVTVTPTGPGPTSGPPVAILVDYITDGIIPLDMSIQTNMQVLTDPSGIYTLVPGKLHDTLYDRIAGNPVAVTVEVPIPRPFARMAFVPEQE